MGPLKALVFDVDDTLFPEESYVESGFHAVANWLEEAALLPAQEAFAHMYSAHARGERGRIFDGLLASCGADSKGISVSRLLGVYRSHTPAIALYPGMAELLEEAKGRGMPIAVISDGFLEAQRQKVRALGLSRWADPILLTDEWGREFWKPNPRAFRQVQETFHVPPEGIAYIGDNPAKDFQSPNTLGWNSIHLVMPHQCASGQEIAQAGSRVHGIRELRAELFGTSRS